MAEGAFIHLAMTTTLGTIELALNARAAPRTVANFMRYVEEDRLVGASFYRAMRPEHRTPGREMELVQGGLMACGGTALPPIAHESGDLTGLRHQRGTISMARGPIGTASSEFFICLADCPGLDPTPQPVSPADGLGYAAFGRVTAGLDVVQAIQRQPTREYAEPALLRGQLLVNPVTIINVGRVPS